MIHFEDDFVEKPERRHHMVVSRRGTLRCRAVHADRTHGFASHANYKILRRFYSGLQLENRELLCIYQPGSSVFCAKRGSAVPKLTAGLARVTA